MAKTTHEKSGAEKTSDINFIDALNTLVDNVPHRKGAKKFSLLLLIRSYCKTDDDLHDIASIPTEELIKKIYFTKDKDTSITPEQIKEKKKNFSSLKSSLNKNLRVMADEGLNPLGIIVGKSNVFNISQTVELERASESVEKDFNSELEKVLSSSGIDMSAEMASKLKNVIHSEFTMHRKGIEKIEEKLVTERANKQLKKKLKEVRNERSSLKKDLGELKKTISAIESDAGESSAKEKIIKDIEKTLTSAVRSDVENNIKALSDSDQESMDKDKALSEKEREILKLQKEMSEKEMDFRKELSNETELLENRFREEKESLQKTIENLTTEQEVLTEEKERILDESLKTQDECHQKLEQLNEEKSGEKMAAEKSWRDLTGNMSALMKDEKEFQKERDYQRRGFAKKEENIQTMAAEQILASMEINEAKTTLEKEKEEFRQELKKKYEEEKEKLKKDMQEDVDVFKKEQIKIEVQKEMLAKEQKVVREKDKMLPSVIEKIVNERLSRKQAELDKKEKRLSQLQRNLDEEEKLVSEEKANLLNEIKAGLGGKTSLLKLRSLVQKQEEMLSKKQEIRETEESVRKRLVNEIRTEKAAAEEEIEAKRKVSRDEEMKLEKFRKDLNQRAKNLAEDKNKAIDEMREKYEKLVARKEKDYEEKNLEWNDKMAELSDREAELLKKQEEQLEKDKELTRQMDAKEEEFFKLMEENIAQKEKLVNAGKQLSQKTANLEKSFNQRMNQVKTGYQQRLQLLEKKNEIIANKATQLKEKEVYIAIKEENLTEEHLKQIKPIVDELKNKEVQLQANVSDLNLKREELLGMRKQFETERSEMLENYKSKITDIDGAIHEKFQFYADKLMDKLGAKEGDHGALSSEASEQTAEEGKGAFDSVKEINGLASGITGETGDERNIRSGKGDLSESGTDIPGTERDLSAGEIEAMEQVLRQMKQGISNGLSRGHGRGSGLLPSSEKMASEFEDEIELAASPKFEKSLSHDYGLIVTLPAGEFLMGCDDIPESVPRHKVKIERSFRISKYPITMLQFLQFTKEKEYLTCVEMRKVCGISVTGGDKITRDENNRLVEFVVKNTLIIDNEEANWKQPFGSANIFEQKHNHPVTQVTWSDCLAYCDWLSKKTGLKYRLPTEKEWEYVASNRGQLNPGENYWKPEEPAGKNCNSKNSFIGDTSPVDYFSGNKTVDGLRDILGNVWEWTMDDYRSYSESPDITNDKKEYKAVRGGSYDMDQAKINFSIRRPYKEMYASSCLGFRVVCEM